jgi:DNA primase catalytic subunit
MSNKLSSSRIHLRLKDNMWKTLCNVGDRPVNISLPCAFAIDTLILFPLQGQLKRRFQFILEEIMLQYAYPRLDINVTKGLNHLLKSPFCVHPKTGKICVPFHPRAADKFDPCSVPTVRWVSCYHEGAFTSAVCKINAN